ncbi:hypothetical protein EC973_004645 [Apophysomyces ossiformis]|uniref:Uncharacterized protein n=1 Tax=Apophysomyces ossiformis TaxID=679940 RepID=A0A8H7ELD0_9FUNG|nr:hypothetical protein EC973_004645 [Apophysomyces ossiformis]
MSTPPNISKNWHLPNESKYEFFNTTPLDEWSLEKYCEHQTKSQNGQSDKDSSNDPSCPKSLRKEFINALTAISKKDLPRDVKTRLGRLIKKCKEKPVNSKKPQQQEQQQPQQQPQQIFHISAPQGNFGAIGGDRSVLTSIIGSQKPNSVEFSDRESYGAAQTHLDHNREEDEVLQQQYEEDSEEDDMEYDADPRSDLTNDYHPRRMLDYAVEELMMFDSGPEDIGEETDDSISNENTLHGTNDSANASTSNTPTTVRHRKSWIVYDFDVIRSLEKFRAVSKTIAPKKLSDMRLFEKTEDVFNMINMDLQVAEGTMSLNSKIVNWSNELSEASTTNANWFDIQDITIPFLEKARKGKDKLEIIAANVLHRLALNFSNGSPEIKLEDSFVHSIVSVVFEAIFQADPLLSYQCRDRYDLAVSEVKPPSNAIGNNVTESDLVKIGKEMAWMLNALINKGVENPVVAGILLESYKMKSFKMDLKYPKVYRMIELSSVNLFDNLQGVSSFPSIFRSILQVKVRRIRRKEILQHVLGNKDLQLAK